MDQNIIVKVRNDDRQSVRIFNGPPTLIPTGDTADLIPLNPAIDGELTVQKLLEKLAQGTTEQSGNIDGGTFF